MKVELGVSESEGSVRHFLIRFESGLILRSHHGSLPFIGKEAREEVVSQMNTLIGQLVKDGHEVTGREWLEKV